MSTQFYLSVLVFMMVQAVLFGVGTIIILGTPLIDKANILMPVMIVVTAILAVPLSWAISMWVRLSNPRALHLWQHQPPHHTQ